MKINHTNCDQCKKEKIDGEYKQIWIFEPKDDLTRPEHLLDICYSCYAILQALWWEQENESE